MVSKDQGIGGLIFIVCAVIAISYIVTLFYPSWLGAFGLSDDTLKWMGEAQFWVVAVPVFIAFIAVMGIGMWIGWTMATTPPPKPIEEITSELEEEEEATEEEAEEDKEETEEEEAD
jgi:hypothetical protein